MSQHYLTVGGTRIAFCPRTETVACPCGGGTITHGYRQFAGGAHEPPSEDYAGSQPCEACGCDNENECEHQPAPEEDQADA